MSQIDELLIEAKRVCGERWHKAPEYPWEVAAQFGAEVERLREANSKLAAAHHSMHEECQRLRAENAELRKAGKGLCSNCGFACSIVDETEELKARLAWFEGREQALAHVLREPGFPSAWANYQRWLSEHPKPEGT